MKRLKTTFKQVLANPDLFRTEWNYLTCSACGLLSGLLLILAFPMPSLPYFAYVAYIPLCLVLFTQSFKKSLFAIIIFVTIFYCYILSWTAIQFHPLTLPGIIIYLYLIHSLFVAIFHFLAKKISTSYSPLHFYLLPLCFTLFEYLRTIGFMRFPYGILAYSQWNFLPFIQFADLTGYLGVSFVLYFINALFADTLIQAHEKKHHKGANFHLLSTVKKPIFFLLAIMLPILAYGFFQLSRKHELSNKEIQVSLIQPWFDFNLQWTKVRKQLLIHKIRSLSDKAKLSNPELIIWPETSLQDYYQYYVRLGKYSDFSQEFYDYFHTNNLNSAVPTYFLVGSLDFRKVVIKSAENQQQTIANTSPKKSAKAQKTGPQSVTREYYNSALFIGPQGNILDSSAKMLLVGFAEWFPYTKYLPFIAKLLASAQASNFTPGKEYKVFTHPNGKGKFSVLICYEDCFSELPRRLVSKGAEFLIVITNDAWSYSKKSEIFHYIYSIFRAVENRRPILRAANAGVTCLINAQGKTLAQLPLFEADLLNATININDKKSFYTYATDKFILSLLSILAAWIFFRTLLFKKQS